MNPNNEVDRDRLFRALETHYRALANFRRTRFDLISEYVGDPSGGFAGGGQMGGGRPKEMYINLMLQTAEAYTMSLAANRPRVLITSPDVSLTSFALRYEMAINKLIQEIRLENVLRMAVIEAFFGVGIVKVYQADSHQVELENGIWADPGRPFCDNVSLDDWVYDTSKRSWNQIHFCADMYRVPYEDLQDDRFDQEVRKNLVPTTKYHNASGSNKRVEQISRGEETDPEEVEPMIDLMDVWYRKENKVYTFACDPSKSFRGKYKPLQVMDWEGPEFGPYKSLSFVEVPDNVMPVSTAGNLTNLSRLANSLMRKAANQARRTRTVQTYDGGHEKDALRVKNSPDGEWVNVMNPDAIKVLKVGGVSPEIVSFANGAVQMFDRMAGNLQAKIGLGPQSPTLGQDQLIHATVSQREAKMQYHAVDFTRRVIHDLAHLLWTDKVIKLPSSREIEGTDLIAKMDWTPERREGDFTDYSYNIDPYSMPYQSPQQRVAGINQILTTVILPLGQMLQEQGGHVDMKELTDIYADLLNYPRLRRIVQFGDQPTEPSIENQARERTPQTPNTPREYIRRSVSAGSAGGQQDMMQQLMRDAQRNQQEG